MDIKTYYDYTANIFPIEREKIGMFKVELLDHTGRKMFESCQILEEDCIYNDNFFQQIMRDVDAWCVSNISPDIKSADRIIWYKVG